MKKENLDDIWKIDSKGSIYAIYGLTGNPFPTTAIEAPGDTLSRQFLESVRRHELKAIVDKFIRPTMQGETTNLWVEGDVGVGKSALLLRVQNVINEKWGDDYLAVFIYSPVAGMEGIYKDFLNNLVLLGLDKIIARLIEVAIKAEPKLVKTKKKITSPETLSTYRDLIKAGSLDTAGIAAALKSQLFKRFPYVETKFVDDLMDYLDEPEQTIEKLRKLSSSSRSPFLISLIHLLNLAGYKAIFLLVDQLESGWNKWTKQQKDRFSIDMRELVVRTKPKLAVEITTNTAIVDDIATNFPTLLRPLPKEGREVIIKSLTIKDILELVEWYLSKSRKDSNSGELAPFDEEAIKQIATIYNRNTDKVLGRCHDLLLACAEKRIKTITKATVLEMSPGKVPETTPPV